MVQDQSPGHDILLTIAGIKMKTILSTMLRVPRHEVRRRRITPALLPVWQFSPHLTAFFTSAAKGIFTGIPPCRSKNFFGKSDGNIFLEW